MSTLTIINNESTGACYSVSFYAQNGAPVNTWYEITYIDVYGVQQVTGFAAGQDANDAFSVDCKYILNSGGAVQGNSTEIPCPPSIANSYTIWIDNITCIGSGGNDGPTGYSNYCTGNKPFNISTLTGVINGYIKMIVDAGTGDMGLQKGIGDALVLNEVIPITENLEATFAGAGDTPASAYPFGNPPHMAPITYTFQYSQNGINGWTNFNLIVD